MDLKSDGELDGSAGLAVSVVGEPSRPSPRGPVGHRFVGHLADLVLEAWGPDESSCLAEALAALVEGFADPSGAPTAARRQLETDAGRPEDALVALLEEVIYRVDVDGEVPSRFQLAPDPKGGFRGEMEVVPAAQAEPVGPVPKAVSYHGLEVSKQGQGWRCRVLVDV